MMCFDNVPEGCEQLEEMLTNTTTGFKKAMGPMGLKDVTFKQFKMFSKNQCPNLPTGKCAE